MAAAFLRAIAAQVGQLDRAEHPFVRQLATQFPEHDDREQFLAGVDLILADIETVRQAVPSGHHKEELAHWLNRGPREPCGALGIALQW